MGDRVPHGGEAAAGSAAERTGVSVDGTGASATGAALPLDAAALLTEGTALPADAASGTLAGRIWDPRAGGPSVVAVRQSGVFDISATFATVSELCEAEDPAAAVRRAQGPRVCSFQELVANTPPRHRDVTRPWLLPPVDLQVIKAAGVTFPVSMLERVLEERAAGDASAAHALRGEIQRVLGGDLASVRPGSERAHRLKELLRAKGLWSQYLEVGIGDDAEIFTKAPVLAAVGSGADIGIASGSNWNNPEPEVVLAVSSGGRAVGAMLGNDVNLRDVEGRSALLLPRAKDNTASCSLGPLLRLFDESFTMDSVRAMEVTLTVRGKDGFLLEDVSRMSRISRDPLALVEQMMGSDHQYPDGTVLMLGTMCAPVADRDAPGSGFTHHEGDVVWIASDQLGTLANTVRRCADCEPWTFGIAGLMRNLAGRGLLRAAAG